MAISIRVCNLALGELRAPAVADPAEISTEMAECKRYYEHCLNLLLERFEWSFATNIATLALLSDNPRPAEWAYAYALPADIATPKRIIPSNAVPHRHALDFQQWASLAQPFIVEAGVLYANLEDVALEYSLAEIPESVMPAVFVDALRFLLASHLAIPLRDSRELKGDLLKQAELATERAIADDRNRQPQRDVVAIDDVALARSGWVV